MIFDPEIYNCKLDMGIHRFWIYVGGLPVYFFSNMAAAYDMLKYCNDVRQAKWVEIIDTVNGVKHYSRGTPLVS